MIDIKVDPQPVYRRRRRNSGFGNGLIRVLFFAGALIPTCIIAWRIDLVNQQPPSVVVQQPSVVPSAPTPHRQTERARPQRGPIEPVEPDVDYNPQPPRSIERQSVEKSRPSQSITLDLEGKSQHEAITLSGQLCVARIEGIRYTLKPTDGCLAAGDVVATLDGPWPILLTISLESRSRDRFLVVVPTVMNNVEKPVPFTTKNLQLIIGRIQKSGRRESNRLASMQVEIARLQAFVRSLGYKVTLERRRAEARINELDVMIQQSQRLVAALEAELKATQELLEIAQRLHGECKIVLEAVEKFGIPAAS